MEETYYVVMDTRLGRVGFVWRRAWGKALIQRICLPVKDGRMDEFIRDVCPQAVKGKDDQVNRVAEAVRGYLDDGEGDLPLDGLDLDVCGEFQKKVLHLNRQIPRGMVATYSGLAKRLHMPQAARAVGNAQARNPFPIVIPCHRVVRSSGALGGFGGGLEMKRKLLDLEGVTFDAAGNVRPAHFWR